MKKQGQKIIKKSGLTEKSGIKNIEKALEELKEELRRIYGERFLKLILYGSYARDKAWDGSDNRVCLLYF